MVHLSQMRCSVSYLVLLSGIKSARHKMSAQLLSRILCLFCCCSTVSCKGKADGQDSKSRSDFEWFSSLGFPDVKGWSCLRFETGGSWSAKGDPISIDYVTAFVIRTNARNLELFTADLSSLSVTNASLPKRKLGSRGFEWVDLRQEANAQI